jgi:hypothetical protein
LRELIDLRGNRGLLSGQPKSNVIKLITVYAPGANAGHLLLREHKLKDGRKALLLSAPDALSEKTMRAMIYVKNSSKTLSLLEYSDGKWKHRYPVSLRVNVNTENGNEVLHDDLLAFSLVNIGTCWLLEGTASSLPASSADSEYRYASLPIGGGITRGMLPVAGSCLLLAIGWTISLWLHKKELKSGK